MTSQEAKNRLKGYKFSENAQGETPTIKNPEKFLSEKYADKFSFGIHNLSRQGVFQLLGWEYNFRPFLKKYVVKQYNNWQEYYAPNKTLLRKILSGRIEKIVEIN